MRLEQINYWRIPRTDDDRREGLHDRVFEMALRWEPTPEYDPDGKGVDPDTVAAGRTHLNRLFAGDHVSEEHLSIGIDYLVEAIIYYDLAKHEPYPGRNEEAARDLRALAAELMMPTNEGDGDD